MQDVSVSRVVKWAVSGIFLVLSLVILVLIFKSRAEYQAEMMSRTQSLQDLKAELETASKDAVDAKEQTETIKTSIANAKEVGDEVASLENQYMELVYKKRSSREEEDRDYAIMNDICVKMDEYFGKDTFLRSIWYGGDMERLPEAKWRFQTNYNYSGNKIPVLWVFSGEDEQVLAYVTGEYDVQSNTFDKYEKHVTVYGNTFLPFTENPDPLYDLDEDFDPKEYTDGIFGIINSISLNEAYMQDREEIVQWNQDNAEDLEENAALREQLREQYEGGE